MDSNIQEESILDEDAVQLGKRKHELDSSNVNDFPDPKRTRSGKDDEDQPAAVHSSHNLGRADYFRSNPDKRKRIAETQSKQLAAGGETAKPIYARSNYTLAEIQNEGKRPKRKVAVMIGYSGSGYSGMQIMPDVRTIEGDLFEAFVKAGAISKANADDPKKSALVRCARTDKGVHAAGNVISMKLIIEEEDIVEKINSHLPAQIRVWGIQRTNGSFSCYTACDSRWYEYLIPSHAFLPPHPSSWLAKKVEEYAREDGVLEDLQKRLEDVKTFWPETEEKFIQPILDTLEPEIAELAKGALYKTASISRIILEDEAEPSDESSQKAILEKGVDAPAEPEDEQAALTLTEPVDQDGQDAQPDTNIDLQNPALHSALKLLRNAYHKAKKDYRISPTRLSQVQALLSDFQGSHNFHNYTVRMNPADPSATRHIKSFVANPTPIIIDGTEWLSLKIHGQSFMMHQIRKMVSMVAFMVRCGTPPERLAQSLSPLICNVPKAPALGLLLERPVFDAWSRRAEQEYEREKIDFGKFEGEMEDFKQREIYSKIFAEEERDRVISTFFHQIDNFRENTFLYLTNRGIETCGGTALRPTAAKTDFKSRRGDRKFRGGGGGSGRRRDGGGDRRGRS